MLTISNAFCEIVPHHIVLSHVFRIIINSTKFVRKMHNQMCCSNGINERVLSLTIVDTQQQLFSS